MSSGKHRIIGYALILALVDLPKAFADTFSMGGKVYENVKVIEDEAQYYIQVPSTGKTLSVTKDAVKRGEAVITRTNEVVPVKAPTVPANAPTAIKVIEPTEPLPASSVQPAGLPIATASVQPVFSVTIRMALVRADLSIAPVPRRSLYISRSDASAEPITVVTNFQGDVQTNLSPGAYEIATREPLAFDGRNYLWNVKLDVTASAATLELSNDNAIVDAPSQPVLPQPTVAQPVPPQPIAVASMPVKLPQAAPSDASAVYTQSRDAVATIETETGQGTGFLVDGSGLVVTNDHVISGSRFFIVSFSKGERYRSILVHTDPVNDVAVLRINPDAAKGHMPLRFAADSESVPAVREGARVYAVGSPLHQEKIITTGIVSKVEATTLISDVMIDHGNSGGPLLNESAEVVGVNTFGEGRGISGIIRLNSVLPVYDEAKKKAPMFWMPASTLLPPYPADRYPAELIKEIVLEQQFDLTKYFIQTNKFLILLLTPPAQIYNELSTEIETAKAREKKRKKKGAVDARPFDPANEIKAWREFDNSFAPTVKVLVMPKVKATGGSVLGALLVGSAVLHYKYAAEFDDLQLLENGVEQPFVKIGRDMNKQQFATSAGHMQDAAYSGYAEYLPEAFDSGPVVLVIGNELNPDKKERVTVPSIILSRIRADFEPLRTANAARPAPQGNGGVVQGASTRK